MLRNSRPNDQKYLICFANKAAMAGYAFENVEIATYTVLSVSAQATGDAETPAACQQILPQEIAMAEWLLEHLPEITKAFLVRSEDLIWKQKK